MDDEFQDLQRLLRLKRYEAPPPEYFEDFMAEFHRRQRAELLRRPIWRLALDRLEAALPVFSVTRFAYTGGCTAAVVAAVLVSARILNTPTGLALHAPAGVTTVAAQVLPRVNIMRPAMRIGPEPDFDHPRQVVASAAGSRPRYVLDTQPVSYEPRSDF